MEIRRLHMEPSLKSRRELYSRERTGGGLLVPRRRLNGSMDDSHYKYILGTGENMLITNICLYLEKNQPRRPKRYQTCIYITEHQEEEDHALAGPKKSVIKLWTC